MKNVNSRANIRNLSLKLLVAAAAFGAASSAQAATTNIPASATVVPPITVSQPSDLRFGTIAPVATAGTIVLPVPATIPATAPTTAAPIITGTRTATGGVIMVGGGTCSATVLCGVGGLQIQGPNSGSFATVTLPATVTLTSGANTMTVGTLTRRYGPTGVAGVTTGAGAFSATGAAVLLIGGTLAVGANQAAGAYTGTMAVTVDY
jgi:Mat/Ecp fimbriae major subunit